ncbi:MAG: hypothetical protein JW834_04980 [Candidatus Diapherotrites archaeon]|nr:hypothetical protein [Candidatus Diapherotrites archaeon]
MRKGEIAFMDLIVASFVFIVLLTGILWAWNWEVEQLDRKVLAGEIGERGLRITDALVKSRGYPAAWNASDVEVVGLADSDRQLSASKIEGLIALSESIGYEGMKGMLGTWGHDFYLRIMDDESAVLAEAGEEPVMARTVVTVRRYALYEGRSAVVELTLW